MRDLALHVLAATALALLARVLPWPWLGAHLWKPLAVALQRKPLSCDLCSAFWSTVILIAATRTWPGAIEAGATVGATALLLRIYAHFATPDATSVLPD